MPPSPAGLNCTESCELDMLANSSTFLTITGPRPFLAEWQGCGLSINEYGLYGSSARCSISLSGPTTVDVKILPQPCAPSGWCAWTKSPSTLPQLSAVWGSDPNNVWAVGFEGTIVKWNGQTWSRQISPTTNILLSVWGTSPSDVWAAGASGTIVHYEDVPPENRA